MRFLKGVYWALDGTLANTELEAHLPAFNLAFNDFGLNWNWDPSNYIELLKINGTFKFDVIFAIFSAILKQWSLLSITQGPPMKGRALSPKII